MAIKKELPLSAQLVILAVVLVAAFAVILWLGFVFAKLWLWIIVPIFGLPVLSTIQGALVMTVYRFVTVPYKDDDKKLKNIENPVAEIWGLVWKPIVTGLYFMGVAQLLLWVQ